MGEFALLAMKEFVLYMRPLNLHRLNHIIPFCFQFFVLFFVYFVFIFYKIYPKNVWCPGLKKKKKDLSIKTGWL